MEPKFTEMYQKEPAGEMDGACGQVADLLDSMVDGEATAEEQRFFNSHIEECVNCFENHQKQKLLKGLISGHLKRVIVPESLAQTIKAKIQETI
ncbi:zf-HC2 domain-containing protein [Pontibacter sp. Tf4]|uniref:anti-sigma factor family protein n=1 Tax=Pontibacter sp. Tf4 TaxID=2761620 RepID=UPI001624614F|nr:zf-HC2 domain-containing protein [Pontibacter sp. Tf4]MBB6611396.1 zf-HC2 domain-containing protein [Pontibacter sp. Tf4]